MYIDFILSNLSKMIRYIGIPVVMFSFVLLALWPVHSGHSERNCDVTLCDIVLHCVIYCVTLIKVLGEALV